MVNKKYILLDEQDMEDMEDMTMLEAYAISTSDIIRFLLNDPQLSPEVNQTIIQLLDNPYFKERKSECLDYLELLQINSYSQYQEINNKETTQLVNELQNRIKEQQQGNNNHNTSHIAHGILKSDKIEKNKEIFKRMRNHTRPKVQSNPFININECALNVLPLTAMTNDYKHSCLSQNNFTDNSLQKTNIKLRNNLAIQIKSENLPYRKTKNHR